MTQVLTVSRNKIAEWPRAVVGSVLSLGQMHLAYNPILEVQGAKSPVLQILLSELQSLSATPTALASSEKRSELLQFCCCCYNPPIYYAIG